MQSTRFPGMVAALCLLLLSSALAFAQDTPVYKDPSAPLEARVDDVVARMTLDEKLTFLGGTGFATVAIDRLGIPPMAMCDGPIGVRGGEGGTQGPATVFPCGIAMAATWNPEMVQRIGWAIGREVQNKGIGADVILGPCICIHRTPLGGRNGESFSEDPFLAARITVGYIKGVQETGAAACAKHYAVNNQEWERGSINVRVDERALREIYLPAFQAAVQEAGVWSIMNAYNKVNGPHCSASTYLLNDVAKSEWGFDGCMMTDWGAAHSTQGVAVGGTDLEMPTGAFMNPAKLRPLMERGTVTEEMVNEKVRRTMRILIRVGLLDGPKTRDNSLVNCQAHKDIVREAGAQSIVLLKNQGGLLPLNLDRIDSIALIGPNAAENRLGMGGSGYLEAFHSVSAREALQQRIGDRVTINFARGAEALGAALPAIPASALTPPDAAAGVHGLKGEYFTNTDLQGEPVLTRTDDNVDFRWGGGSPGPGVPSDNYSVRWTGTLTAPVTGDYQIGITSDDGSRLFLDGQRVLDTWRDHAMETVTARLHLEAGQPHSIRFELYEKTGEAGAILGWNAPGIPFEGGTPLDEAVAAAAKSDVAIVMVGLSNQLESEGRDRDDLELPPGQNELIKAVVAANPNTVVVLTNGTPLLMGQWLDQVPAVLEAWYLGEQGGNAVTDVLLGDVNPSAKLPDTLAMRREDYPDFGNYPGGGGEVNYAEGIFVGYRHFDRAGIAPAFPFGHGLSYTTFEYSDLRITPATLSGDGAANVTLTVRNTGQRAGTEVVQLYIHDPAPQIEKAPRELKGFARVTLEPGESKTVSLPVTAESLAYCDVPGKQWRADAGTYEVQVGSSSRDIRLRGNVTLAATWTQSVPNMGIWMEREQGPALGKDLARGKAATASSVERPDTQPAGAFDGEGGTRWSSAFSDPQWLSVDLGDETTLNGARLRWEAAYASAYSIQVSSDGQTWTDAYVTDKGNGEEEVISFAPVKARYVRLLGRQRGTEYGYSLYDFNLYGPQ